MDGNRVELTAHEFDVLGILIEEPEKVIHRTELMFRVWGEHYSRDNLDQVISKLRKKLCGRLIRTVRYYGYSIDIN